MRKVFFTSLVAALTGFSTLQLAALAQNNNQHHDSQAGANQSSSSQHQGASNSAASDNKDNSDKSSSNSANSDRGSKNDSKSSHSETSANSSGDRDRHDNDRNTDRSSSNRESNSNNNQASESGRENRNNSDRSEFSHHDRDSKDGQTDRNSHADDRGDSRSDRHRNYKQDFKFGRSNDHGLTLSTVTHNSVFYKGGLRDNDVIVSFNGHRIHNEDDFGRYVIYERGRVPVVVYRNGHEQTIYVVFDDRGDIASNRNSGAFFGAEFDHKSNNGAVIARIEEDSPADRAGLEEEDVVTAINGDRVTSGREAEHILGTLDAGQRVEVEYKRPGRDRRHHVEVKLGGLDRDSNVETAGYQSDDHSSTAVEVQANSPRREYDRDRRDNNQDRREDRRDNRSGLLPHLRN